MSHDAIVREAALRLRQIDGPIQTFVDSLDENTKRVIAEALSDEVCWAVATKTGSGRTYMIPAWSRVTRRDAIRNVEQETGQTWESLKDNYEITKVFVTKAPPRRRRP